MRYWHSQVIRRCQILWVIIYSKVIEHSTCLFLADVLQLEKDKLWRCEFEINFCNIRALRKLGASGAYREQLLN